MDVDDPRPYAHLIETASTDIDDETITSEFLKKVYMAVWEHMKDLDEDEIVMSQDEAIEVLEGVDLHNHPFDE